MLNRGPGLSAECHGQHLKYVGKSEQDLNVAFLLRIGGISDRQLSLVMADAEPPAYVQLLRKLDEVRKLLAEIEYEAVRTARQAGVSWQAIADELDMSRQAASSYFSRPKGRRQPPRESR